MPKVSVIVPIYNVEQYLRECLDSIINQTLNDIEIICVNDGSTDGSLSIIQEYALKDNRIKVVNKHNTGYGHSMNIGLSEATGEYIGIVESDDFASLQMFEKMYNVAVKHSAEVVKCNYFEYRDSTETYIENLKECNYNNIFLPIDEQNIFYVTSSIWSGIYKRTFLINNNIYFNETPGASYQDTSFAFKVWSSVQRVYLIKDALLNYRKDNMDSSVNSASKIFCICDEYDEIKRFVEIQNSQKSKLSLLTFAMKFKSYKWNYNHLISAFQYAFLLRMVEELKKDEMEGMISTEYLNPLEIQEIYDIIHHTGKYFKDTAKDYHDSRLSLTSNLTLTLNSQFYKNGLLDCIKKFRNVIIYGAGVIGKIVGQKLICDESINNILCFAVSDLSGNSESLLGIPVYYIRDLIKYTENSIVLVATKQRDQYDIIKLLRNLDFKSIVSIDSNLLSALNHKG